MKENPGIDFKNLPNEEAVFEKAKSAYVVPELRELPYSPGNSNSPGDLESPGEFNDTPRSPKLRTFNDSIAILLRSYARAINKQQDRSGALFREDTKAKTGWIDEFITVDRYRNGSNDFRAFPDDEYGWYCFNYIHENPVKARLEADAADWAYSSARDFAGLRSGSLCNQALARQLLLLP